MAKKRYQNLDTTKFKYTKIIKEQMLLNKKDINKKNRYKIKEDRTSSQEKLLRRNAVQKISQYIVTLRTSGTEKEKMFAKQLALEKEYINVAEKQDLREAIKAHFDSSPSGTYTLAEIGKVLGLTRERVRQIETGVLKVLKHPITRRTLREMTLE